MDFSIYILYGVEKNAKKSHKNLDFSKNIVIFEMQLKINLNMENKNIKMASSEATVTATNPTTGYVNSIIELKSQMYKDFVQKYNETSEKKLNQVPMYNFEALIIYSTSNEDGYYRDFDELDNFIINLLKTKCRNNYQAAFELWFALIIIQLSFYVIIDEKPMLEQEYEYFETWCYYKFTEFDTAITPDDFENLLCVFRTHSVFFDLMN